jgi:CHAT domain-containing protein
VLAGIDGVAVAHLACHGHFRADSPLFSSLELADGHLHAHDLRNLRLAPELIILSACDLAVSRAFPGDELLGFAAALLDMGTRVVIASVTPVPDAQAKRLMLGLHRRLIAGMSAAAALADARTDMPEPVRGLDGFLCLGSA